MPTDSIARLDPIIDHDIGGTKKIVYPENFDLEEIIEHVREHVLHIDKHACLVISAFSGDLTSGDTDYAAVAVESHIYATTVLGSRRYDYISFDLELVPGWRKDLSVTWGGNLIWAITHLVRNAKD